MTLTEAICQRNCITKVDTFMGKLDLSGTAYQYYDTKVNDKLIKEYSEEYDDPNYIL